MDCNFVGGRKMKYFIFIILVFSLMGCNKFKNQVKDQLQKDNIKYCLSVCSAIEALQCWDSPDANQVFDEALTYYSCVDNCLTNDAFKIGLDLGCLTNHKTCDLGKCLVP